LNIRDSAFNDKKSSKNQDTLEGRRTTARGRSTINSQISTTNGNSTSQDVSRQVIISEDDMHQFRERRQMVGGNHTLAEDYHSRDKIIPENVINKVCVQLIRGS
jgi:hypothetical protein